MGASIITGYTGTRHITPEMDGAVYRGIIGDDSYILAEGDQCEGSMPSVNQFTVKSGVVSIQGRQIYITQETLAVDTCPTGYKRIDLVCVRFEHDTTSLIDQASLIVIKGAEVSGGNDPVEPAHNEGVIKDGATVVDFVMYRLDLDGANVEITKTATVQSSLYMSKETQEKWNDIAGVASNDAIMDYLADNSIVEQGTDGYWTYRKWGNGTAECWLHKSFSVSIQSVASYYHRGQINNLSIPSGLFIESPACIATSNSSTFWIGTNGISTSVIGNIYIYDVVNGSVTIWISIYLIGKWK